MTDPNSAPVLMPHQQHAAMQAPAAPGGDEAGYNAMMQQQAYAQQYQHAQAPQQQQFQGQAPFPQHPMQQAQQIHYQQQHHQHQQQRQQLQTFWTQQMREIEGINDFKNHQLPLARIKKIMKSDEEVRMISAEAPVLFAKACEMFILELTLRSWIHSEENKRRTLQRNDIAAAITKTDIFDFLVDIVPRDDLKDEGIPRPPAAGAPGAPAPSAAPAITDGQAQPAPAAYPPGVPGQPPANPGVYFPHQMKGPEHGVPMQPGMMHPGMPQQVMYQMPPQPGMPGQPMPSQPMPSQAPPPM